MVSGERWMVAWWLGSWRGFRGEGTLVRVFWGRGP